MKNIELQILSSHFLNLVNGGAEKTNDTKCTVKGDGQNTLYGSCVFETKSGNTLEPYVRHNSRTGRTSSGLVWTVRS